MGQKSSARCATRPPGDIGQSRVAARGEWLPAHRANLQVEKALPFRRCCADASGNAANVQTPGGSAVDSSFFACDELGWRNASCLRAPKCNETASILFSAACKPGSDCWRIENRSVCPTRDARPVNSSSLVRFLPVSQYLLELASLEGARMWRVNLPRGVKSIPNPRLTLRILFPSWHSDGKRAI